MQNLKVLEQKFKRKSHEIFMLLDSDKDGYIMPKKIDFQWLNPNFYKLIEPVIKDLNMSN